MADPAQRLTEDESFVGIPIPRILNPWIRDWGISNPGGIMGSRRYDIKKPLFWAYFAKFAFFVTASQARPPGIPVREFPGIRHVKNSRREFPGITEFSARISGIS